MKVMRYLEASLLRRTSFAIISDNCWGYSIYKTLGREYNTPFVGLYMQPHHYLEALKNLESFLDQRLFQTGKKTTGHLTYPVATTESGIEINFMHYPDFNHAYTLWRRRAERLREHISLHHPVRFKFCDREGATKEELIHFKRIISNIGPGVSFSTHEKSAESTWLLTNAREDGVSLYRQRYAHFDFIRFLQTGEITRTPLSIAASLFGNQ